MIEADMLARLLAPGEFHISIYLPVATGQRDLREPETRLDNLIRVVEAHMERGGMEVRERQAATAPLRPLAGSMDFASPRQGGLGDIRRRQRRLDHFAAADAAGAGGGRVRLPY